MRSRSGIHVVRPFPLLVALALAGASSAQSTVRADADASGRILGGHGWISGSGRWILVETDEPGVPQDTNRNLDVYARDRLTGAVDFASATTAGGCSDYGAFFSGCSPDGRFVLLLTDSTTYSSPPPVTREAYVRDRSVATTTLASCNAAGLPADGFVWFADLSDDGTRVVFSTEGGNFGVPDPNGIAEDIFLRDLAAGTTTLISVTPAGTTGNHVSSEPSISGDGRWIAYITLATDLVPGTSNGVIHLMLHDFATGATMRVDAPGGTPVNGDMGPAVLSQDGRWVAFHSRASNLVPGDTNGLTDVFLMDRVAGSFQLLTRSAGGAIGNDDSFFPAISSDGRYVAFQSRATNLVPNDLNQAYDAFLSDVVSGTLRRLSVSSTGWDGVPATYFSEGSDPPTISDDGRFAVFTTGIAGLVAGDNDGFKDPLLRDELSPCAPAEVYCTAKVNSAGCVPRILSAGDPYASGPDSFFVCALDVLTERNGIFLWGLAPAATPFGGGTLCVAPPLARTPVQFSGPRKMFQPCAGRYGFHFSQAYQAARSVGAGTTIHGQFWSRDPGFAQPDNVGLADAIRYVLGP